MTGFDVTLLRPWWLLALPLLAFAAWWLHRRAQSPGDWGRVIEPELMAALSALGRVDGGSARIFGRAALLVAAITVVALAGPAVERRDAAAFRNLDGAVFVIDASPSVMESPRWPQMQAMGRFGIAALGARPGGLVVFAGDAYVATDITGDIRQLGQTLSLIDDGTVPDPGSRPERGLALAARMLSEADVLAGDVVLFTDGGGQGPVPLEEAAGIAGQGARLSVVSMEAPDAALETLAEVGGGQVFTLDQTDAFAVFMGQSGRERLERQDYPLLFWADLGRLVLALALIPALLLFRRVAA
ncbi:vWA domain-containing protein [Roseivivax sediminis]|uniref:Ca-activated chloride channel family protein n=1 Tax=Roseivivax sediminis TaxID=936889 RepID=A0A1I1U378_9RHOB|nr:vWA domain-containing protein [Roseivivax sediminis]SFD63153.1 Ca-activated chloride channel family protein [Roseivivax sediminis]